MAGETIKSPAICLRILPWSRTSHVVSWLTPEGRLSSVVKGAVRPKSAFLGQYDLNYTCEIVYYARARGDLHALRECHPLELREKLRTDYRTLVLSEYFRDTVANLAPIGPEAQGWYDLLAASLDGLLTPHPALIPALLAFELKVLEYAGLAPELEAESGAFVLRGERKIPVSAAVARCLRNPHSEKNTEILLDAARVIGVFYAFHVDRAPDVRRTVLRLIS
ncbi:MAG: DNA repair protein RecO [Kiritimatiellia bacterium]